MKPVFVPKTQEEKRLQRALLQYFKPENKDLVIEALVKAGRRDLIGTSPECLVAPSAKYAASLRKRKNNSKTSKKGKHPQNNRRVGSKLGGKWDGKRR